MNGAGGERNERERETCAINTVIRALMFGQRFIPVVVVRG